MNGDKVTGDFSSYGLRDFYVTSNNKQIRLFIDDYFLNKSQATKKI